jgi:type II secretory pathway predicted ATPase ExeA/outer membrane protein OmpA-like peptidoglycan-associated protein
MYESFFGFKDTPFRLSADEKFRYAHKNYLRASAYLAYALQQSEGFVMITGQPGSGKTTLVRDVISEIDSSKFNALNLMTSQLQAEELLRKVALEYGLPAESYNKATLLTSITKHLSDLYDQGKRAILFLDEAQNLSVTGLEELRLLSNLQKGNSSLLQIVLIGHDELRELVLNPDMEHIQQRLIAACQIKPMSAEQTKEYINHRLEIVGWQQDPELGDEAYALIHMAAQGVPRKINHLMSRLLLFASLEEKHVLVDEDVLEILEELVEERRITLADNESFSDFAERYRNEKYQREMDQQVVVQKKVVHDIFENRPLQDQFFNEQEVEKQQDLIASTQHITENLLSAIDAAGQDIEEAWDLPDSDWGDWESDLTIKKPLPSGDMDLDHAPLFESSEFEMVSEQEAPVAERVRDVEFPSADDIWNNGLDSDALDSLILEQQKQRNTNPHPSESFAEGRKSERSDDEHQWGGVWWMSSEQRERAAREAQKETINNSAAVVQSSVPVSRQASRINVEENLSMPSMWVDSCPEAATGRGSQPPFAKPPQHKLGAIVLRLASWLGITLLIALFYSLFATQINQYFTDVQERIVGMDAVGQPQPQSLETESSSAPVSNDFVSESPQPVVQEEPEEDQNNLASIESPSPMQEEDISQYPQDLSGDTIDHIEIATRYAVFFNFNRSSIPTRYVQLLRAIQYKMFAEEGTFLRIIGYADTQGDKSYNYRLSLKRADEVKQYFVSRGIAGDRLHVTAVGTVEDEVKVLILDESAKRRRVEMILFPNRSP